MNPALHPQRDPSLRGAPSLRRRAALRSRIGRTAALVFAVVMALTTFAGVTRADSLNRWRFLSYGPQYTGVAVVPIPSTGQIYAADWYRVRRSDDGGRTWATVSAPCTNSVMALAVDPATPTTAYVGCESGGIEKSTDGGATWQESDNGIPVDAVSRPGQALAVDPSAPSIVYAAGFINGSAGIWKSTDAGASWTLVTVPPATPWSMTVDPAGTVYVSTPDGVMTSVDRGSTWSSPSGPPGGALLATDPSLPGRIWAAGSRLWRSDDSGATWTSAALPYAGQVEALAADAGHVYVSFGGVIDASSDLGNSWHYSGLMWPVVAGAIAVDPADPSQIYVAGNGQGFWKLPFATDAPDGFDQYWLAGTTAPTDITPTSATLNGILGVTAADTVGSYSFFWGPAGSLTQHSAWQPFPSDHSVETPVSDTVTGLTPATTYDVRLVGDARFYNARGYRDDSVRFTTPPAVPPAVAAAPTVRFRRGRLVHGRLPALVRWTTAAGTFPACTTSLQRIASGSWQPVTRVPASKPSATVALRVGTSVRFRARAADCNGLAGAWTSTNAVAAAIIDDASRLRYRGGWTLVRRAGASGGRVHVATRRGATATLTITGNSFAVLAHTGPRAGAARVAIDGGEPETVTLARRASHDRTIVFTHHFPIRGQHTVTITRVSTSRRIALDAIAVLH